MIRPTMVIGVIAIIVVAIVVAITLAVKIADVFNWDGALDDITWVG